MRTQHFNRKFSILAIAGLMAVLTSSCNVFDPLDSPSGAEQIKSAARACFDQGDFACASKYYSQVSATDESAAAELAFFKLDQAGVKMSSFLMAFGTGGKSVGGSITKLANTLAPIANETTRVAILDAYLNVNDIQTNELRGLIRFIAGSALVAEILAEDAGTDETLTSADLVKTASGCKTAAACAPSLPPFLQATPCDKPTGKKLVVGPTIADLDKMTVDTFKGTPTLNMIAATLSKIMTALNSELNSGGLLGTNSSDFASGILDQALSDDTTSTQDSPCFRFALISNGVGG